MEQLHCNPSSGLRIVLIDPHAEVRSGLARSLRADRRVSLVTDVANVEHALPLIDAGAPHVVLIDPGIGEGAGRNALRSLIDLRSRSVWFLIAAHLTRAEHQHLSETREMGADAYLLKGFRTGDLVTELLRQLEGRGDGLDRESLL